MANHVVCGNYGYAQAVKFDINSLQRITSEQIEKIHAKGFSYILIAQAVDKLLTALINNQNKETASNGSKAQDNAYQYICPNIKLHIDNQQFHLFAYFVSKNVTCEAPKVVDENGNEIKTKETVSKELTLCQDQIKYVLNFKTKKFRNYIVEPNQLTSISIEGEKITFDDFS